MMSTISHWLKGALLTLGLCAANAQAGIAQRAEVQSFIDEMVREHRLDREELNRIFARTEIKTSILKAMSRPAEGKPWHEYRPIFLTEDRINKGVRFWRAHRATLERAEQRYGVDPAVIVAILGVETRYGGYIGSYRVVDALATLGFDYPRRAEFFLKQLEAFLLMSREEGFDALTPKGSYAGAMGVPQFIPTSFRAYAVDFDGDGKRDLWESMEDVIGSVANYFHLHHWQPGGAVAHRATLRSIAAAQPLIDQGYKPSIRAADLVRYGAASREPLADDAQVALLALDQANGKEYWIAEQNFYVITRYNHSPLYAMAVYQLSEAIRTTLMARD